MNRKRFIGLTAALTLVATTAFAFYLGEVIFTGEGSARAGNSSGPVMDTAAITIGGGITPGESRPVAIVLDNTSPTTVTVSTIEAELTTSAAGCLPAWFKIHAGQQAGEQMLEGKGTLEVPVGESELIGKYTVTFANEPLNQNACEGQTITLKAKVH